MIDQLASNTAGTENQLIKMINGLDRDTFEVCLVSLNDHPWLDLNRTLVHCPVKIFKIKAQRILTASRNFIRLVSWLRNQHPDIVHTFFPIANILGVLAARISGVPRILSSRRDYGEWMLPRYLQATRFANRFVSRIVTNSDEVKKLTVNKEGFDSARIDVIYNGIDLSPFARMQPDHSLRTALGIPEHNKVVGIVANFRPMKRHETFLRAARKILDHRDDIEFLLIGETVLGDRRQEMLEQLATDLNVTERLHFTGKQNNVLPYLSIMDIGVNCSQGEGLSNAIMEYMAAGIACVVSDSGGNTDLIQANVHGLVFPLDDYDALANAVLKLLSNSTLRSCLQKQARLRIDQELALPAMIARVEKYYRTVWHESEQYTMGC